MNVLKTKVEKKFLFGIMLAIGIFLSVSCAQKEDFAATSVDSLVQGYVKVERDNNRNYIIRIHLSDLVEATELNPSKQAYVVWLVTDEFITKNIGQVTTSSDMILNGIKNSFETVSSFKPSKIFITAENDAVAQHPGVQVILATNRF